MPFAHSGGQFMGQQPMMPPQFGGAQYAAYPQMGFHVAQNAMHGNMQSGSPRQGKGRMPTGQTNYMQQQPQLQQSMQYAAAHPLAHNVHRGAASHLHGMQGMDYVAMQQRAEAVQQYQMQQYQQMEASMMQQLQHKQDNALLKYGNFDNAHYRQQDLQSRPEFRTY